MKYSNYGDIKTKKKIQKRKYNCVYGHEYNKTK